ncbi:SDR family oxidoreductase [Marinobacter koreensis]|uniref:SDR family oxidoreductase n=1 Tax=Marinobacter koreensis TaxID=335974 RepID=A0ABW0RR71_9GAMM|nr:SDR family oxidoreductase [Marinobacter koreensis]
MNESGELILITGGARGIGRGLVKHFADRDRFVVFCDTDREQGEALQEACGENVRYVYADVSQEEDVRALLRATLAWKGRLNGVINNAGIADPETGPIESLSLADWQRRLDVNLTGPFLVTKHAVPHLRQSRGSIVNMASTRALQSEPDTEAYAATKGGIVALTHALAMSLGPDIRVNSISPGWIDTRAWQGESEPVSPLSAADHQQHPAGRVGEPRDIAGLAEFLLSDAAAFITGQNIVADGGMTRKMIYQD